MCKVDGCLNPPPKGKTGKSLCDMHRSRKWRTGSVGSPSPVPILTIKERLAAMSVRVGDCLVWTGTVNNKGYGRITLRTGGRTRTCYAHRVSYAEYVGPVPPGLDVLHSCDNPPCIEPSHLRTGTPTENAIDMVDRARHPRYLTLVQVAELNARFERGHSDREIAAAMNLPKGTVSARRFRWRRRAA